MRAYNLIHKIRNEAMGAAALIAAAACSGGEGTVAPVATVPPPSMPVATATVSPPKTSTPRLEEKVATPINTPTTEATQTTTPTATPAPVTTQNPTPSTTPTPTPPPTPVTTPRPASTATPDSNAPIPLAECYTSKRIVHSYDQIKHCIEPLFQQKLNVDVSNIGYGIEILSEEEFEKVRERLFPEGGKSQAFTVPAEETVYVLSREADDLLLGVGREVFLAKYLQEAPDFLRNREDATYVGEVMSSLGASIAGALFEQQGMRLAPQNERIINSITERYKTQAEEGNVFRRAIWAEWAVALQSGYDGSNGERWNPQEAMRVFNILASLPAQQALEEITAARDSYELEELVEIVRSKLITRLGRPASSDNIRGDADPYLP